MNTLRRRLLAPLALLCFAGPLAGPLGAQQRSTLARAPAAFDSTPARYPRTPGLVMAGTIGSLSGILLGGYIGARLELADGCSSDLCGLGGGFLGAALGGTLLSALAVHAANDGRGRLGRALAYSAAGTLAAVVGAAASKEGRVLLLVPVGQIAGAVLGETEGGR